MTIDRDHLRHLAQNTPTGPWRWFDDETDEPVDLDDPPTDLIADRIHSDTMAVSLRTEWTRPTRYVGPLPEFLVTVEPDAITVGLARYLAALTPDVLLDLLDQGDPT